MNKIVTSKEATTISQTLRNENKVLVIAGGCFDLLHIGHIQFLQAAKRKGDILMLLLESDETIRKVKGINRPLHTQKERATMLSALTCVDYIVMLPHLQTNETYDKMIFQLKPAIIATTKGDNNRHHKVRQAKQIGATVIDVISRKKNVSTTTLIDVITKEL